MIILGTISKIDNNTGYAYINTDNFGLRNLKAEVCATPGIKLTLKVGDEVWVMFENNRKSLPVIIGYRYKTYDQLILSEKLPDIKALSIEVNNRTTITNKTQIKDISGTNSNILLSENGLKSLANLAKYQSINLMDFDLISRSIGSMEKTIKQLDPLNLVRKNEFNSYKTQVDILLSELQRELSFNDVTKYVNVNLSDLSGTTLIDYIGGHSLYLSNNCLILNLTGVKLSSASASSVRPYLFDFNFGSVSSLSTLIQNLVLRCQEYGNNLCLNQQPDVNYLPLTLSTTYSYHSKYFINNYNLTKNSKGWRLGFCTQILSSESFDEEETVRFGINRANYTEPEDPGFNISFKVDLVIGG